MLCSACTTDPHDPAVANSSPTASKLSARHQAAEHRPSLEVPTTDQQLVCVQTYGIQPVPRGRISLSNSDAVSSRLFTSVEFSDFECLSINQLDPIFRSLIGKAEHLFDGMWCPDNQQIANVTRKSDMFGGMYPEAFGQGDP